MSVFAARFLVEPGRFPEPGEGRPFGTERLGLRLAGHELEVVGLSEAQIASIGDSWREFRRPRAGEGAMPVTIRRAEASRFRDVDRRGFSYDLDFEHGRTATRMAGLDLMGRLDWEPLGGALWTSAEAPQAFRGAFENFLRVLLAHLALDRGGVLLHSSCVLEPDGGARLFVGPSGAGKSTVARLALRSGRSVASDDLNPVLPESGVFCAWGSPFLGDVGARAEGTYPVRGIYRLEKGEADAIRPMSPAESVASLLACSPFVNRAPHLADRLWKNLAELAGGIPAHVLTFRLEGSFWRLLEEEGA